MMRGFEQSYIVIGGWSITQTPGPKEIVLMRGNGGGERREKVLESLPAETTWQQAKSKSDEWSSKLGVRVGRNFTSDEWAGKVQAK